MTNLQEILTYDIERCVRLLLAHNTELDPQLRIATPEGDYAIAITLSDHQDKRLELFKTLRDFMAFKQALAFTFVAETVEPDAITGMAITPTEQLAGISFITREEGTNKPQRFSQIQPLDNNQIDTFLIDLLPKTQTSLCQNTIDKINHYFGEHGLFPAIPITLQKDHGEDTPEFKN